MSDENRIISQEEIEAILRSSGQIEEPAEVVKPNIDDFLTKTEQDALGEMGNICMGTAATTMYTLLGKQVSITTPQLSMHTWETLAASHVLPFVVVEICYIEGIEGNNLLLLKEFDVALITDLLMGGDGNIGNIDPNNIVLDEIHLSAIREVMNQMVGSSSTSLATLLGKTINISTPVSKRVLLSDEPITSLLSGDEPIVKIAFKMEIEGLLESEIMQVLPASFAKRIAEELLNPEGAADTGEGYTSSASFGSDVNFATEKAQTSVPNDFSDLFESPKESATQTSAQGAPKNGAGAQNAQQTPPMEQQPSSPYSAPAYAQQPAYSAAPPAYAQQPPAYAQQPAYNAAPPNYGTPPVYAQQVPPYGAAQPYGQTPPLKTIGPVRSAAAMNVQEIDYPNFDSSASVAMTSEQQNIYRLLDVPMEVMVELGRAKKTIKQVLDLNIGSVVVLDKLAGEEVEILVNGIQVARGEVVVIDDSYGVRITELNPMMISEATKSN